MKQKNILTICLMLGAIISSTLIGCNNKEDSTIYPIISHQRVYNNKTSNDIIIGYNNGIVGCDDVSLIIPKDNSIVDVNDDIKGYSFIYQCEAYGHNTSLTIGEIIISNIEGYKFVHDSVSRQENGKEIYYYTFTDTLIDELKTKFNSQNKNRP